MNRRKEVVVWNTISPPSTWWLVLEASLNTFLLPLYYTHRSSSGSHGSSPEELRTGHQTGHYFIFNMYEGTLTHPIYSSPSPPHTLCTTCDKPRHIIAVYKVIRRNGGEVTFCTSRSGLRSEFTPSRRRNNRMDGQTNWPGDESTPSAFISGFGLPYCS